MANRYTKGKSTKLSENFNSTEFDCHCGQYCSTTLIDPQLVEYLQKIRDHFGKPIRINSGYRCSKHNVNVGGASQSYHTKGMAADIYIQGVTPGEVAQYAESIGMKGIGVYSTFTHVDTRENKYFWYDGGASNVATFGGSSTPSNPTTKPSSTTINKIEVSLPTLQQGAKNYYVRVAQALLGISVDGVFGKQTALAVYNFQKKVGLTADKIVGKNTWDALFKQGQ